jgi:cell division protein FtsN
MNSVSSNDGLMEIRVSPAVVVVVLVLVAAILVGLYFMVLAKAPPAPSTEAMAPLAAPPADPAIAPALAEDAAANVAAPDKPVAPAAVGKPTPDDT